MALAKKYFMGKPDQQNDHRINDQIKVRQVRLINTEDQNVGVVDTSIALQMAKEADVDLVEIAPNAKPPVCKLMNYGKFVYNQKKKQKSQEAANRIQEDREIRLRPASADHDLEIKSKKAREFLSSGCKVRLQIKTKGRERFIIDIQESVVQKFYKYLDDIAKLENVGGSYTLVPLP